VGVDKPDGESLRKRLLSEEGWIRSVFSKETLAALGRIDWKEEGWI
jgi:hypothetical protein